MLKKAISFSLILAVLFFVYQYVIVFLKSEHSVTYELAADGKYVVTEDYIKKNGNDYYLIRVVKDDYSFVFDADNIFNKQKEIVEEIVPYEDGDLFCITLVFKNKSGSSEPLCYNNGVLSSYSSVKNLSDFKEYTKSLPGFELDKYDKESERKAKKNIIVNTDYFTEREIIPVYGYKEIIFADKYFERSMTFSNKDNYKNTLGHLVNNYYIIPKYTGESTFNSFVRYELNDGISKEIKTGFNISRQSYINGVYNNQLYLFDKSSLRQYRIDPKTEEVTIVGSEKMDGFAYINGEEKSISVYDLNSSEITFSENTDNYKNIDYDEIFVDDYYAIYRKGNAFYKVYANYPDVSIYLFSDNNIKEIKVKNQSVYYLKDDGIYRYSNYGKQLMITNKEFLYNYENVFDIFLKED